MLARDDASTLNFPLPDAIFGFHAQQSVEKAMKALLSVHGRRYPLTHELKDLLDLLESCSEGLSAGSYDFLSLQPYAVELRYHLGDMLSEEKRLVMREAVVSYHAHVVERILQLETPSPH